MLIVGTGNAAFCAGLSAQALGKSVLMIDAAPELEFGGNSRYTAGAMRFAYSSRDELLGLLTDPDDARLQRTDFGEYSQQQFLGDLRSFNGTQSLTPQQHFLVEQSLPLMNWLRSLGITFSPIYSRQAFEQDGRYKFWGGLTLCAEGEGEGLVQRQRDIFRSAGGEIRYDTRAVELLTEHGENNTSSKKVVGVLARCSNDSSIQLRANAVVLACGGFEASEDLRVQHLGPAWQHAKVRGSRFNQGHGITMAQRAGAALAGRFTGCHATPMDRHMPNYGNPDMPHIERKNYRKISYPFGVMLNAKGERFVDEGANFRNYTYAQYGQKILEQPKHFAWQIFDAQVMDLLYEEYRVEFASRVEANSLVELVDLLDDIDQAQALATLTEFNSSITPHVEFDPTIKDGRATAGLPINKTNWALRIEQPPFVAYPVTCGITFSYGGLNVNLQGEVLDAADHPVRGLFACGELVGDVFFEGYPGGSGLTSGGVFGRTAGANAAAYCDD